MTHRVVLTRRAQQDLQDIVSWWSAERSATQANRWLAHFGRCLKSLARFPMRCPLAAEYQLFAYEIREIHFGLGNRPTHRAVFTIAGDLVLVLAVRHAARDELDPSDVSLDV